MANVALIIAGGSGVRMGQNIPKQFLTVNEKPVIIYTLEAFQKHPEIDAISVVCIDGWEQILLAYCKQFNISKLEFIINGGENGQKSICNGIFKLYESYNHDDIVLVHDAIRPLISSTIISECIKVTKEKGCAITSISCAEAMLQTVDGESSSSDYPRTNLRRTQTPQGFYIKKLYDLHVGAIERGITNSIASCTLMVEMGEKVYFSQGSEKNIKLTTVEDIDIFKALLAANRSEWLK